MQVFHCVHFECPAQEDGAEESSDNARQELDGGFFLGPALESIAPPVPAPMPGHLSPRRTDRDQATAEEELNLPSRFTANREMPYQAMRLAGNDGRRN